MSRIDCTSMSPGSSWTETREILSHQSQQRLKLIGHFKLNIDELFLSYIATQGSETALEILKHAWYPLVFSTFKYLCRFIDLKLRVLSLALCLYAHQTTRPHRFFVTARATPVFEIARLQIACSYSLEGRLELSMMTQAITSWNKIQLKPMPSVLHSTTEEVLIFT